MTQKANRPGLKQEATAVLGIFLSLFIFLCLFSFHSKVAENWCGELGRIIAEILIGFTGWGAYGLPILILALSLRFFAPSMSLERLPQVTIGLTGAIISFCGLLSSFSLKDPRYIELGGFLGRTFFRPLNSYLGEVGSILTLTLVALFSLMLAVQFSPYQVMALIWKGVSTVFTWVAGSNKPPEEEVVPKKKSRRPKKEKVPQQEPAVPQPASVPVVKEPPKVVEMSEESGGEFALQPVAHGDWKLPPLSLLSYNKQKREEVDKEVYYKISKQLEQKLKNFGVSGKVVGISPGPVVTTYEYAPAPGIKINKIVGLADDLALGLKAQSVRVIGSVPGKAALGIEIPNTIRNIVYIRELLGSEKYRENSSKLSIVLGLDVIGNPTIADLAKMPHLLIAGATGAGKSVAINTIIASILFNASPEEVRFLMVDPKRIELSGYEGIPHLLHPVVVEPKMASRALQWAVREMERRYRMLEEAKVKSFNSYNESQEEKMPYIVVIVDELADLMMVASKDVEGSIARLAQMARAAGIHLILATQRPSVDVLTGLIKANFPTRISFKVSSKVDSRTIIDTSGAEHLLGAGDMLFLPPGSARLVRIHGAFISEEETAQLINFWKEQGAAGYDETVLEEVEKDNGVPGGGDDDIDDRYDEAVAVVCDSGGASISMLQRRLRVGYNRAARMIEKMEQEGIVGPADGSKPREVLVRANYD